MVAEYRYLFTFQAGDIFFKPFVSQYHPFRSLVPSTAR